MAVHVKVGGDVDTQCSRCRLELAHVIVAMDGARIARVQCKTCGSVHAYRGGASTQKAGRGGAGGGGAGPRLRSSRSTSAAAAPRLSEYESMMEGKDVSRAKRYKPSVAFDSGEVIDHATFGLGLVMRVLADQKIEAIFRDGLKVLAHARC